jgi:hypothetical protein
VGIELNDIRQRYGVAEVIAVTYIKNYLKRLRSYELLGQLIPPEAQSYETDCPAVAWRWKPAKGCDCHDESAEVAVRIVSRGYRQ